MSLEEIMADPEVVKAEGELAEALADLLAVCERPEPGPVDPVEIVPVASRYKRAWNWRNHKVADAVRSNV